MEGIEQQLQHLPRRRGLRPLPESLSEIPQRRVHRVAEPRYLLPKLDDGGPHAGDGGVDIDEPGAEADEVSIVAIDEVDELGLEGGEMGSELLG